MFLYLAGRGGKDRPKRKQRIGIKADSEAILAAYRNTLAVCDQCRKNLQGGQAAESRERKSQGSALTKEELSLCAGLLGAAGLRDGEYALEEAQKVQRLLEAQGYEVLDCSEKTLG